MQTLMTGAAVSVLLATLALLAADRRSLTRHLDRTVRAYSDLAAEQAAAHDLLAELRSDISRLVDHDSPGHRAWRPLLADYGASVARTP